MGCTHCNQIGRIRAAMNHATFVRTHHIHHIGTTTKRGNGITIAHGFCKCCEISIDTIK